ncbi:hypothetical protein FRC03_008384 [Tulasnella sp. 419]|nr:hypothetical protein FRC03_008384 [Tulasnella sp. 419]
MGYPHVIFFRPGPFKNPPREGTRRADESVGWLRNVIYSVVPSVEVPKLAKSIYVAGALGAWELHSADEDISKIFLDSKECLVVGNTGSGSLGLKYFG